MIWIKTVNSVEEIDPMCVGTVKRADGYDFYIKNENGEVFKIDFRTDAERIAEIEKRNAELVAENERMRCCGNCANTSVRYGHIGCRLHLIDCHGKDKTNENYLKHWKRKEIK